MATIYSPSQCVQKAYLKDKVNTTDIKAFRDSMAEMFNDINAEESEEFNKNLVIKFLNDSVYKNSSYRVNTYQRTDLAIYKESHPIVLFEFKGPGRPDMVTRQDLNKKSIYELILYYLREEVKNKNNGITHLVITDCVHYFVFEKKLFYRLFARSKRFAKSVLDVDSMGTGDNNYIYNNIIRPEVESVIDKFEYTYIDLSEFSRSLRRDDIMRTRKFVATYKFFAPIHLLRLPYTDDHNSLDKNFYRELLYIMGVEEVVDDKVHKIVRLKRNAQRFSLMEQTFAKLEDYGFGEDKKEIERRFDDSLGLVLVWINRILFLKLVESQLIVFNGDDSVKFLDDEHVPGYDELNDLFSEVLAKPVCERSDDVLRKFPSVPYLNSSLFELTTFEKKYFPIGQIRLGEVEIYSSTVLKDESTGRRVSGRMPLLSYLFKFLSSYDFGAEKNDDILRTESKTIINASVLGLFFEKINGYKDGSFFTPGYITEYICSQNLRQAVVNKFNSAKGWKCKDFEDLKEQIDYRNRDNRTEANNIINSLRICDPAVGSGHFLVSALNELIAIKSDLHILQDHSEQPKRIQDWDIRVENDELVVFNEDGDIFQYNKTSHSSQLVQETLFEEKRTIIENCLFGVDLNPKSVDICQLRLWIELLKNAYYYQCEDGARQLQTLPNIDINIKQGNSLASLIPVRINKNIGLGEVMRRRIQEYKKSVAEYKNAPSKLVRNRLRNSIKAIKVSLQNPQLELFRDNNEVISEDSTMSHTLEWMIEFPEIISDEAEFQGFDVIIGNPPYISLENLRDDSTVYFGMRQLDECNNRVKTYNTLMPRGDIYTLFVERGLLLLKKGGILSYIMPNKWTKVMYGKPLRSLFLHKNLTDIVDFGDNQIFEDATTYTCIISMSNNDTLGHINISQIEEVHSKTLADDVNESKEQFTTSEMDDNIWVISSIENFHKMKALQLEMPTLNDYVGGESYRGILTGLTDAFKVRLEDYDQFVNSDETSRYLLRPFLQGAGLVAFGEGAPGSYLLFIPKGFTANGMDIDRDFQPLPSEDEAWKWFSEKYPSASNRLLPFRDRAKRRIDKGDYWWELRACAYYDKFAEPKIFYQVFQVKPCFVYDDSSAFFNNSMFFLSVPDKALLALLCSEIGWWLIREFCPRIQNGRQLIWDNFKQIPIPSILPDDLNTIAEELMKARKEKDEDTFTSKMKELNQMVEKLYSI